MKERPILFSGPMVRAILAGVKTQTRRIVKPQPVGACTRIERAPFKGYGKPGHWVQMTPDENTQLGLCRDRFGVAGDRLWVRETFSQPGGCMHYRADVDDHSEVYCWKPSIFMRRHQSRILLEVVDVRVERLLDISETDAEAEGCARKLWLKNPFAHGGALGATIDRYGTFKEEYRDIWNEINGAGAWDQNPWVWVVTFRKL